LSFPREPPGTPFDPQPWLLTMSSCCLYLFISFFFVNTFSPVNFPQTPLLTTSPTPFQQLSVPPCTHLFGVARLPPTHSPPVGYSSLFLAFDVDLTCRVSVNPTICLLGATQFFVDTKPSMNGLTPPGIISELALKPRCCFLLPFRRLWRFDRNPGDWTLFLTSLSRSPLSPPLLQASFSLTTRCGCIGLSFSFRLDSFHLIRSWRLARLLHFSFGPTFASTSITKAPATSPPFSWGFPTFFWSLELKGSNSPVFFFASTSLLS